MCSYLKGPINIEGQREDMRRLIPPSSRLDEVTKNAVVVETRDVLEGIGSNEYRARIRVDFIGPEPFPESLETAQLLEITSSTE